MSNLVLIDANNLCHRVFWTHKTLSHRGKYVGLLYGFFRSLISLKKKWGKDWLFVVAWDYGKSKRRVKEAQEGIEAGILEEKWGYKANRDENKNPDLEAMFMQMEELHSALNLANVFQCGMKGVEADDLIFTYACNAAEKGQEVVIVSSDKDFYQVLRPGVKVYDAMKKEMWTRKRFEIEFDFPPEKWVDVGALEGDTSDNIAGIPGWGPVMANKYIRECGSLEGAISAIKEKPKRGKKEQVLLENEERARLCYSLKKMDMVPDAPKIRMRKRASEEGLKKWFLSKRFASLMKDVRRLV